MPDEHTAASHALLTEAVCQLEGQLDGHSMEQFPFTVVVVAG